jgi:hypothetical protein
MMLTALTVHSELLPCKAAGQPRLHHVWQLPEKLPQQQCPVAFEGSGSRPVERPHCQLVRGEPDVCPAGLRFPSQVRILPNNGMHGMQVAFASVYVQSVSLLNGERCMLTTAAAGSIV